MSLFQLPTARQLNLGLAILRTAVGAIFVAHGGQKLFVFGLNGVSSAFGGMGIPMPELFGPLVAFVEFFGGLALIAGILTRLVAVGHAAIMLGAMLFVHLSAGFFLPSGYEFTLALLGSSVVLALTGAGAWSLDALVAGRKGAEAIPALGREAEARRRAA